MATYSGAWRRATLPIVRVPRHPPIDPEHARPVDVDEPSYYDLTGAPPLPDEWAGGQYVQSPVPVAISDQTPQSHTYGVVMLPGVDQETAALVGGRARAEDLGADDARRYARPAYQEVGARAERTVSPDWRGDSPETLRYQRSGVGVDIDPFARSSVRIRHYPSGPARYDARWYDDEMRPRLVVNARGSRERPPVPNRQPNTPPEGAGTILRPDNWAEPVIRRTAPSWDQAFVQEAYVPSSPDDNFGLGRWGL